MSKVIKGPSKEYRQRQTVKEACEAWGLERGTAMEYIRKDGPSLCAKYEDYKDLEALCRSLATALNDWQQFDTEFRDENPCPDITLRRAYRERARANTGVALTEYKKLLGD